MGGAQSTSDDSILHYRTSFTPIPYSIQEAKQRLTQVKNDFRLCLDLYDLIVSDDLMHGVDKLMTHELRKDILTRAFELAYFNSKGRFGLERTDQKELRLRHQIAIVTCPASYTCLKSKLILDALLLDFEMLVAYPCPRENPPENLDDICWNMLRQVHRALQLDRDNHEAYLCAHDLLLVFSEFPLGMRFFEAYLLNVHPKSKDVMQKNAIRISDAPMTPEVREKFDSIDTPKCYEHLCEFMDTEDPEKRVDKKSRIHANLVTLQASKENAYLHCHNHVLSIDIMVEALDRDIKRNTEYLKMRASKLINMQKYEKAAVVYTQALDFDFLEDHFKNRNPEKVEAQRCMKSNLYMLRASAYMLGKCSRFAVKDLEQVLKLSPQEDTAVKWRAWCYKKDQKFKLAIRDYETYLELHPSDTQIEKTLARLRKKSAR